VATYTTTDGSGTDDTSTLTITVTPVDDAPVANDDVMNTSQDTPVSLDVTANDTDPDTGDTLTVTQVNGGAITAGGASVAVANGTVSLAVDGKTLTFNPTGGYTGPVAFDYTVSDGALTDTANITGTVSTTAGSTGIGSDDDFVYDEVTNADKIPEVGGSRGGIGYNDTLAKSGAVLDLVESVNKDIEDNDYDEAKLAGGDGLWDVAGVKGFAVSFSLTELSSGSEADLSLFPLRIGAPEAEAQDQLIVKSILRDRTLFLEVDYTINSDPNLLATRISVMQVNGNPLPEWLRVDDRGRLVSGEPPVGTENIELRIEIKLSNDTTIVRYVDVNVNSGEIASLEQFSTEVIAGASLFENQIEKEAIKFENASIDIEKSFIN
ncbi:MAG: Ig-like domain-containing protein, partial [Proteobacteria bacterium]|nr:Ig-like domain-containing protein [Pseudomonadota bacterium]